MRYGAYELYICPTCGKENFTKLTVKKKSTVERMPRNSGERYSFTEYRLMCQCVACEHKNVQRVSEAFYDEIVLAE